MTPRQSFASEPPLTPPTETLLDAPCPASTRSVESDTATTSSTNFCKFSQNPDLQRALAVTGEKHIAEASAYDHVQAVGDTADHRFACETTPWRCRNLLHGVRQDVREGLHSSLHATSGPLLCLPVQTPTLTDFSRAFPTADGMHETSPSPPQKIAGYPTWIFSAILHPGRLAKHPLHSDLRSRRHGQPIPRYHRAVNTRTCTMLTSGILNADDASFTTEVLVHSGPTAAKRCKLVALLDTGCPQSFITAAVVEKLKASRSATGECERQNLSRSWGGFATSTPLSTSFSIRLSTQFKHHETPTAALAVWACVVPAGNMHDPSS